MPQSERAKHLTAMRLEGAQLVSRLTSQLAEATQELTFFRDVDAILMTTGLSLPNPIADKAQLGPILEHRKVLLEFRLNTARAMLQQLAKYTKTVVCQKCRGSGQVIFSYEPCTSCSGTGIVE